jgi:hypothetical protein
MISSELEVAFLRYTPGLRGGITDGTAGWYVLRVERDHANRVQTTRVAGPMQSAALAERAADQLQFGSAA